MAEEGKSDLEPMKGCPRCGNETSEKILNDIGGCYFCGNADFSEEAYRLPDDSRKLNCSLCGKLVPLKEMHTYNPLFYTFSKKIIVGPFDWVNLCPRCDSETKPTIIKITQARLLARRRRQELVSFKR